jgi:ligand-binding SRPBCC domain-containing protein
MGFYSIKTEQFINADIDKLWAFFSNPANLAILTPEELNFVTTSESEDRIYAGQIITYTIRPLLGIKLKWMTEITHVHNKSLFVDEQRAGPYKLWHHQHHFILQSDRVLMKDIVHYSLPFGFLGKIAHYLFVRKKLEHIFKYRREKIDVLFNKK